MPEISSELPPALGACAHATQPATTITRNAKTVFIGTFNSPYSTHPCKASFARALAFRTKAHGVEERILSWAIIRARSTLVYMDSGLGESRQVTSPRAAEPELRLLTELSPWHREFLENLADTLLRRRPERVWTTSPPAKFWPDVFVPGDFPWARMCHSASLHVLALALLIAVTHLFIAVQQRQVKLRSPDTVLHYDLSEYLPPINTGSPPAPKPRHGEPLLAKQQIISLPPRPDNFEQTIVSPIDVKLPANVPLPNIVAWTNTPAPPSADALRKTSQLKLPQALPNVIAPPPQPQELDRRALPQVARNVIGPAPGEAALTPEARFRPLNDAVIAPPDAPDTAKLRTPRDIIAVMPAVMPPPPDANLSANVGAMNIGKLLPAGADPKLVVPPQQAIQIPQGTRSLRGGANGGGGAAGGAAPQIPVQGALANGPLAGQLIALNLHPAVPAGPLSVPPGRRSGEFAAGPEGKPNAPGTPEVKAGATGAGGSGTGTAGPGNSGSGNLPPGIVVGAAPNAPLPGSVVVAGTPAVTPRFDNNRLLTASVRPPRIGDYPPDSSNTGAPPSARL